MKNLTKLGLVVLGTLLIFNSKLLGQVPIAQTMYGLSAWHIDLQSTTNTGLQGYWKKVKESGVRYVRVGGIDPNISDPALLHLFPVPLQTRSEEHTSELQSLTN